MSDKRSAQLHQRAQQTLPGGVNSPVRAFHAVGGAPVFIREASGAILRGEDAETYIDYVLSWGPMILGHAHPEVIDAIKTAAERGTSFGAPTEGEVRMAEVLREAVPSIEMSRLVSSGTEATMAALRLARGYTGRDRVVKCIGAYHGGADSLLVKAGSGLATLGEPDSAGVPDAMAQTTLLLPYNDTVALETLFARQGEEIAALIVEPVAGNMGCVPPDLDWLKALRKHTKDHGALLIFDEVMTGFRVAYGGAQALYGVTPDLTCLGKIVGGGLPVGAYGGPRGIMERIAPLGPVYQAGTLSGNPLAVAAGLKTLELLRRPGTYEELEKIAALLELRIREAAQACALPCTVQRVASMLTVFFGEGPIRNWEDADSCDKAAFARWHRALLAHGVYWPPSPFEAAFVSVAHDSSALDTTARAMERAFSALK